MKLIKFKDTWGDVIIVSGQPHRKQELRISCFGSAYQLRPAVIDKPMARRLARALAKFADGQAGGKTKGGKR